MCLVDRFRFVLLNVCLYVVLARISSLYLEMLIFLGLAQGFYSYLRTSLVYFYGYCVPILLPSVLPLLWERYRYPEIEFPLP